MATVQNQASAQVTVDRRQFRRHEREELVAAIQRAYTRVERRAVPRRQSVAPMVRSPG